ncbi:hypothetical protein [Mycolicibacterium wolinskyi]|uniref:hypothetical protein n=1 Tax=Mycolicibacterium wolinskyi TaxID=59750 RepID=UPI001054C497|nr:hypothetical protein [Mycolicibacterium wolinskyi]
MAQVDRVLSAGVGLFPEFGGGSGRVDGGGPVVPGAPSGGRLQTGVEGAAGSYRQGWTGVSGLDADTNTAAADGRSAGEQGRGGASGVRDSARSQAAAIAPATGTPAGSRLMVSTMDERLAAMQQQIDTTKAQNKLVAARVRQLAQAYRAISAMGGGRGMMGGMGMPSFGGGGMPTSGGGGGGIPGLNALSSLSSLPSSLAGSTKARLASASTAIGQLPAGLGGPLTGNSTPREVAARIIWEAHRRNYSREETIAALSTAIQESGLSPKANGGGGAWHGIYQQDTSYAGRDDPNKNIESFFNRLDKMRASAGASSDIWKNIFWLQQRPGEDSAGEAFSDAQARREYLSEIKSRESEAEHLFDSIMAT